MAFPSFNNNRFDDRLYPGVVTSFEEACEIFARTHTYWGDEAAEIASTVKEISSFSAFADETFDFFYGGNPRATSAAFMGLLWSPLVEENPVLDFRVFWYIQSWAALAQQIPVSEATLFKIANTRSVCRIAAEWQQVLTAGAQAVLVSYSSSAEVIAGRWDLSEENYLRLADPIQNKPTRTELALNMNIPKSALVRLCDDPEAAIRTIVASRPELPAEAWWKLSRDEAAGVREAVLNNREAPDEYRVVASLANA